MAPPDPWIEKFTKEVLPLILKLLHPEKVLLFGSRALGQAKEESDIDTVIISDAFQNVKFVTRTSNLLETVFRATRFPKHVDYLCYTPEEFERLKKISLNFREAMRTAKDLVVQ